VMQEGGNMTECVLSTVSDGVRTITLNRPDSLNAMNLELVETTRNAFRAANADDATKVVIFTGAGRAFCAGDDLKDEAQHAIGSEAEKYNQRFIGALQDATREIVLGDKFVVGAINGWAVGGGLEWAINCDFPIWGESAKGFFPEVSLNLFVTGAVTSLLPALVGLNRAREMLLLGERYGAAELKEIGVAWRVVPDETLLAEAQDVASKLAELPPLSVRAMKRVLNQCAMTELQRALNLETEATIAGFLDPKTTELLKSF